MLRQPRRTVSYLAYCRTAVARDAAWRRYSAVDTRHWGEPFPVLTLCHTQGRVAVAGLTDPEGGDSRQDGRPDFTLPWLHLRQSHLTQVVLDKVPVLSVHTGIVQVTGLVYEAATR